VHPILFRIGPLDIHTYGVLVALGFIVGLWIAARRAPTQGIKPEQISDLGVWLIIAGMAGGKLFHIIFFWDEFMDGWRQEGLRSLREGFVFYGGFIGACLTTIAYARMKRLPLWKLADVCAPSVALGHAFGRLGCFFNGCCYGKACSLPWAVRFPSPHLTHTFPVHPTQLYEVLGNVAIFAGLSACLCHKRFDGQVWWLYVLSYGALRFVIELFRGDYETYYFGVFTLGHIIATVMIAVALIGLKLCKPSP
jgi:phosphatidylglycerol:prolipoprotein diacylglycerol transferase